MTVGDAVGAIVAGVPPGVEVHSEPRPPPPLLVDDDADELIDGLVTTIGDVTDVLKLEESIVGDVTDVPRLESVAAGEVTDVLKLEEPADVPPCVALALEGTEPSEEDGAADEGVEETDEETDEDDAAVAVALPVDEPDAVPDALDEEDALVDVGTAGLLAILRFLTIGAGVNCVCTVADVAVSHSVVLNDAGSWIHCAAIG